jgi:hypothetical protein
VCVIIMQPAASANNTSCMSVLGAAWEPGRSQAFEESREGFWMQVEWSAGKSIPWVCSPPRTARIQRWADVSASPEVELAVVIEPGVLEVSLGRCGEKSATF